ncbi:FAD-dependent monooxygenase [Streptomyces sp. NBC_01460]|uniref:FAD-dependent monooxygenase n=1 Tax=Streptomyces sp. NBC_01460 TaxID=2903875 RepID=UPI002E37ED26|nr:FAD-dependent monooxygenase [Streptomyces sp. NBC_01460]
MTRSPTPRVLIVGAGPTGLTAACTLLRHGVKVRVVDRRHGPTGAPKALILWSGALEVLDRLETAVAIGERSLPLTGASYWSRGRRIAGLGFGALRGTRFPGPLCVPQPVTEELLYERLIQLGGTVEWSTEAESVTVEAEEAAVVLNGPDGDRSTARAPWLIAADGAHSKVREALGIPFEGSTYARDFLLGDGLLEATGATPLPPAEAQYHLTPDGVLVVVALPEGGHRVFFDLPAGSGEGPPDDAELQQLLDARGPGGWTLTSTAWTSRFRVHTKVAAAFRSGPVLLAGDAAHCHSPAGGQGLNTGVQDGYDLGWKLAAVCSGADPALLDSYEAERRPSAVRAVGNADRQTKLWLLRSVVSRFLRDTLLRRLSASGALEKRLVPELAQVDLDLTGSPIVSGTPVDGVRPGRRVPDTALSMVYGREADSLHGYVAAGRHTVVVLGVSGTDTVAVRAAETAAARHAGTAGSNVDVLLIRPSDRSDAFSVPTALPAHDVAAGRYGTITQALYVRPDGVVGARVSLDRPGRIAELLAGIPVGGEQDRVPHIL